LNYLWYATLFIVKDNLVCTYIYEVAKTSPKTFATKYHITYLSISLRIEQSKYNSYSI